MAMDDWWSAKDSWSVMAKDWSFAMGLVERDGEG
jgi:hypothetical protein